MRTNKQSIAKYQIKNSSQHKLYLKEESRNNYHIEHHIKLYNDGTTLEMLDVVFDDYSGGGDAESIDDSHEETWGTYENSSYKKQLKNVVIQNHREGKLKELPRWL